MAAQAGIGSDELAQLLFRQQVVEVPLDGALRRTVAMQELAAGQSGRQVETTRPVPPLRQVDQRPQVVVFVQGAQLHMNP